MGQSFKRLSLAFARDPEIIEGQADLAMTQYLMRLY